MCLYQFDAGLECLTWQNCGVGSGPHLSWRVHWSMKELSLCYRYRLPHLTVRCNRSCWLSRYAGHDEALGSWLRAWSESMSGIHPPCPLTFHGYRLPESGVDRSGHQAIRARAGSRTACMPVTPPIKTALVLALFLYPLRSGGESSWAAVLSTLAPRPRQRQLEGQVL
jgi:hypothetical protein